jgi:hypothetical protein
LIHIENDPCQEAQASGGMNQKIPESCCLRCPCPAGPDQEYRANGEHFPEDKERKNVSCKDNPQGAAGVNKPCYMLEVIFDVKGIKKGDKGYEMENVTKKEAQSVYLAKNELPIKEPHDPVGPFRDADQVYKSDDRYEQQIGTFPFPLDKGNQQSPDDKYECWRNGANHSNPLVSS